MKDIKLETPWYYYDYYYFFFFFFGGGGFFTIDFIQLSGHVVIQNRYTSFMKGNVLLILQCQGKIVYVLPLLVYNSALFQR